MRRLMIVLVLGVLGLSAVPANAGIPMPASSRFMGRSYTSWAKAWTQWGLGDASNPFFAALLGGDCGDLIDGVFFMAPPIDLGVELDCDVPTGVPILVSHAGFFVFAEPGQTDAEIEQLTDEGFTTVSNHLSLDGRSLPLIVTSTGAFDVTSEPGSFYDAIIGLGTGTIRNAIEGNFTMIHALPPGDHTLEGSVLLTDGENYSVTYTIHVG
jgi:hypothetical protein